MKTFHRHTITVMNRTGWDLAGDRVETCYGWAPPGPVPYLKVVPDGIVNFVNVPADQCRGGCVIIIAPRVEP